MNFQPPAEQNRSGDVLAVFDQNITYSSPAGSCLLKLLTPLTGVLPLQLFVNQSDIPPATNVEIVRIPLPPGPVFMRAILFTLLAVARQPLHRRNKSTVVLGTQGTFPRCDICYAHCCHRLYLSRYRAFVGGKPLRRAARLLTHSWNAVTEQIAFRNAKTIVVPSAGLARELNEAYPHLALSAKLRVISNPVDTKSFGRPPDFDRHEFRRRLNVPPGVFLLSFCALGNFEWKGLGLIFEALSAFREHSPYLVVIGGSHGEIREFEQKAKHARVSDLVRFTGFEQDVRPYFWASDAFVLPSVYEGFPLVSLQAAAAQLPLIATRVNGVEEFMIDGVTGWIIERTAAALRSAIHGAISDPERTARMGEAARERVQAYRVECFEAQWAQLLRESGLRW